MCPNVRALPCVCAGTFTTVNEELWDLLRALHYGPLLDSLDIDTFSLRRGVSRALISLAQQQRDAGNFLYLGQFPKGGGDPEGGVSLLSESTLSGLTLRS
jgi:hypothetical protein